MINLTPISERIQKRLFEKMRALGRSTSFPSESSNGVLTHDKMVTRSTFIRMISGQVNPVILMGGKLKDEGNFAVGYDDIYGTRTYTKLNEDMVESLGTSFEEGNFGIDETLKSVMQSFKLGETEVLNNPLKRPMPGIKSIDASFKGSFGLRSLREATINWTCWSWSELNQLMPHFLAHGKTVLLE